MKHCCHVSRDGHGETLKLLQQFEDFFDGTLGYFILAWYIWTWWNKHEIGVLYKCSNSLWVTLTFIIPKKNGMAIFISDFRYFNKCLIRSIEDIQSLFFFQICPLMFLCSHYSWVPMTLSDHLDFTYVRT